MAASAPRVLAWERLAASQERAAVAASFVCFRDEEGREIRAAIAIKAVKASPRHAGRLQHPQRNGQPPADPLISKWDIVAPVNTANGQGSSLSLEKPG